MKLIEGAEKFKSDVYPGMENEFHALANGQSPDTLFITCSDSRIDPALLMQTKPGEIFVIRNAGNIVPLPGTGELSVEATVQYAVDVLKVKQVVVCGHSHCGAISALMDLDSVASLPVIRDWVKRSEKIIEQFNGQPISISKAIEANVLLQLDHLQQHECVKNAIEQRGMTLHGWVYSFETGEVKPLEASTC
jgi:carbonic anhydrase